MQKVKRFLHSLRLVYFGGGRGGRGVELILRAGASVKRKLQ